MNTPIHKNLSRREQEAYKARLHRLTKRELEILTGMVLGDAHIEARGHGARLHIRQGGNQAFFVDHLFEVFRRWTWMDQPTTYSYRSHRYREEGTLLHQVHFKTFNHPVFQALHGVFYRPKAGGGYQKVVPPAIEDWLTPRVLAYHIMCDGSMDQRSLRIATHDLSPSDCQAYVRAINARFGLHGEVRPHRIRRVERVYPFLWFPVRDQPTIKARLRRYMLPGFASKIGIKARGE